MIIHCAASEKLFYMDETPPRKECPICGSSKANYLSTTVVFGADAPEEGATAPMGTTPRSTPQRQFKSRGNCRG